MAEPTAQTCERMKAAARLKASGKTWEEVAELMAVSRSLASHWPSEHPELWVRYLHQAIDEQLADVENESVLRGRILLRSESETIQTRALEALLRHCRELRGTRQKLEVSGPEGGPVQVEAEIKQAVRQLKEVLEEEANDGGE